MSGGSKSTTINNVTPYGNAQGVLSTSLTQAQNLFGANKLAPYGGLGLTSRQGLGELTAAARAGVPALEQAMGTYRSFANGGGNVGTSGQQQIFSGATAPTYSEQNLAGIARGDLLNKEDPDFERLLASASEKAATQARMSAGAMGRYGGDYAQSEVARTVGDLEAGQRVNRLMTERDRMMQANSMLDQFRQSGLNLGLNAANSRSSIDAANADRRLGAASGIPGMYEASLMPARTKADVGAIYDQDVQRRMDVPGDNLAALMQILGVASPYATQTATTRGPNNTTSQLLGGGLGLASLFFG